LEEIKRTVTELDCPEYAYELVKRAISMSLDRSDRAREQISQLLSSCYPDILSTNMIGKGFERLFELVDELVKDVPSARDQLATFLARCVIDEVLPPAFLSDIVVRNLGGDIVEHAKRMLSREHASAMLERPWGPGDGRPVQELKVAVDLLLQEYILSSDTAEACR
jgi:programmed cell death protein 4